VPCNSATARKRAKSFCDWKKSAGPVSAIRATPLSERAIRRPRLTGPRDPLSPSSTENPFAKEVPHERCAVPRPMRSGSVVLIAFAEQFAMQPVQRGNIVNIVP
jgi:hypothetical protein